MAPGISLCAGLILVNDTVWIEKDAALDSMPPYCNCCDKLGHTQEYRGYFEGRAGRHRTEHGFVPQRTPMARMGYKNLVVIVGENVSSELMLSNGLSRRHQELMLIASSIP